MSAALRISVIIPSLGDAARAKLLDRAIESVLAQEGVNAVPIVVVNGNRHDPTVLELLLRRTDIHCEYLPNMGLPEARLKGRELVDAPFFAYLDDDDELLPHSLETRLRPLLLDEQIDVVISNGYRDSIIGRVVSDPNIDRFQNNPLEGLMDVCWLNANGGLFRSQTIGREYFVELPPVVEWIHIAFKLAQSRKIQFLNIPTFVQHVTPKSLYSSKEFFLHQPFVLRKMLDGQMPEAIRSALQKKYIAALHHSSEMLLEMRDFHSAWRYHLLSLRDLNGLRYLGYTRRIVWKQIDHFFTPEPQ